jgi:hypothetical protein
LCQRFDDMQQQVSTHTPEARDAYVAGQRRLSRAASSRLLSRRSIWRALSSTWRETAWPLFHIQHRSKRPTSLFQPDSPGIRVKPEA